ncbi:MAG TPA: NAD(P)/FAD-dependent oxidoreductase [Candidatus Eremiobacteraceae bacterium]|nr:NAD(P)/FAD-dependent oxidoreductase [Candidatus Eremiobacteraceae bacterium]
MSERSKVIIIGGGFGGLSAAQALKSAAVDVTVIDRRNYHLFQPLLYQVATGSLSPGEVAAPLRGVLGHQKNTRVLLGDVEDIDPVAKRVLLADGASFEYDSLIVAAGSQTSYYGHGEWEKWAPGLKSVEEATTLRHKILYAFEVAERLSDPAERRAWLNFVIVGAGPTGVELAGAIGEIARQTLKNDFRSIHPQDAQITLLDAAPRLLMTFPEDLAQKAERSLAKLGVRTKMGTRVHEVDRDGVTLEVNGSTVRLSSKTVIWAGGVTVAPLGKTLAKQTGAETDHGGRIKVGPDLTIANFPDIYVIGDLALSLDAHGKPLAGVAQVAMQQGVYAAEAIVRKVAGRPKQKAFRYFDKGTLAVIGRAAAVANVFGVHLSGLPAWLVWAFIHLMYIVEFQSRIVVFIQWAIQDVTFSRGARLITGVAPTDFNFNNAVGGHSAVKPAVEKKSEPAVA